ncbi:unnamed protein product [Lymnaea stagnalis]|uniref:Caspase recruitment domain-containing protein n=1 Tax=Lymnaea stagnalis TaxID=6523 RepID=A0AAV2II55_LYMST
MTSAPLEQRPPLHQLNEHHPLTSNQVIVKSQSLSIDCGEPTAPRIFSPIRGRGKNRSTKSSVIGHTQKKPMRGRLKPRHHQVILQNYEYLKLEIDARHITGHMVSNFAISLDDKEEINAKTTQSGRTECFLDRLLVSGRGQSFDTFMDALRRNNYVNAHRKIRQDLQKLGQP